MERLFDATFGKLFDAIIKPLNILGGEAPPLVAGPTCQCRVVHPLDMKVVDGVCYREDGVRMSDSNNR